MSDELDALREQHKNSPTSLAAKQALINGLEAAPATDVVETGQITRIVRRQCTDDERRRVVEKYLI